MNIREDLRTFSVGSIGFVWFYVPLKLKTGLRTARLTLDRSPVVAQLSTIGFVSAKSLLAYSVFKEHIEGRKTTPPYMR